MRGTSAYYAAPARDVLATTTEEVIGHLAMADPHRALESTQKLAWAEEIDILREALITRQDEATLFLHLHAGWTR